MAIAAIVATMTVARHRNDERAPEPEVEPRRAPAPAAARLDLDALRSAGL